MSCNVLTCPRRLPRLQLIVMYNDTTTDIEKFSMLTATAALGGVRALMGFYVLSFVTATSTAVVNIFTQDLNILLSIPLQHLPVTPLLGSGLSVSMGTSGFYTYIKMNKGFIKKVDETCGCVPPPQSA